MDSRIFSVFSDALNGTPLSLGRALAFLAESESSDLLAAGRVAASAAAPPPFLCGIINAKSGRCSEDCAFCAQSSHHSASSPVYPLVGRDALLEKAEELARAGAAYMGIVISGGKPGNRDFDRLLEDAGHIRSETGINLCASFGLLQGDQARALKQAGFSTYHHNLECAPGYYPRICSTHGIEPRLETVRLAGQAGLRVCSGGLFGLGEDWHSRLELAETLRLLEVDCVPVNFLTPIQGTPLQDAPLLPPGEALAIVALFRLMLPSLDIVICGGRSSVLGNWQNLLFASGANGLMTGDYLTTKGNAYELDQEMLRILGIRPRGAEYGA